MEYTNRLLVSNYLQRDLTEHEVAMLMVIIPAIRIWLDKKLDSTFVQVDATTRYYDGGSGSIDIDPATEITSITEVDDLGTVSNTYVAGTDYSLDPVNDNVKREIVKRYGCWPRGSGRIAVTAKFSEYDNGVPQDIQTIATVIAAEVLNQGKLASSGGNVASESLEGHSISYDTTANNFDGMMENNPAIKSILELRRELYLG